jgi:import inner membrane translocase subunit TIM17
MDREPCPHRIIDDAGGAFCFGLVGGAIWHGVGGARNAPSGQRMASSIARMKSRTPILGGSFAIWGTLFSVFDCSLMYVRKKEDPWNAILSGGLTGGILAARAGYKAAGKNALMGGLVLAAIEGLNVVVQRALMPFIEKRQAAEGVAIDMLEPPNDPLRPTFARKQINDIYVEPSPPVSSQLHHNDTGFDINTSLNDDDFNHDNSKWETKQAELNKQKEEKPAWKFW